MNSKKADLPIGDHTPENFKIEGESKTEQHKKKLRKLFYPAYTFVNDKVLEMLYGIKKEIGLNKVLLGQRGNDYEAHRKRINKISPIKGKTILILGCGTSRDVESWLKYKPKKIIGVDYFNYDRAWKARISQFKDKYNTEIEFFQSDINKLHDIQDEAIDIIGSDAVFEHLREFKISLKEMHRVLKKDSVLYATFGPLWCSWGGDHLSGSKGLEHGYNHIAMEKEDYNNFIDTFGEFTHDEGDGRTWIYNDLFSYLKPKEYLDELTQMGFKASYSSAIIDPRALSFKNKYPQEYEKLIKKYKFSDL
mgnify:CR=1 FL=1